MTVNSELGTFSRHLSITSQLTGWWQRAKGRRGVSAEATPAQATAAPLTIVREDAADSAQTVLRLAGVLDATTYEHAIDAAHAAYADGRRSIVLDFSAVRDITRSGMYALTSIALTFDGHALLGPEYGYAALRQVADLATDNTAQRVVVLNPSDAVADALRRSDAHGIVPIVAMVDHA